MWKIGVVERIIVGKCNPGKHIKRLLEKPGHGSLLSELIRNRNHTPAAGARKGSRCLLQTFTEALNIQLTARTGSLFPSSSGKDWERLFSSARV